MLKIFSSGLQIFKDTGPLSSSTVNTMCTFEPPCIQGTPLISTELSGRTGVLIRARPICFLMVTFFICSINRRVIDLSGNYCTMLPVIMWTIFTSIRNGKFIVHVWHVIYLSDEVAAVEARGEPASVPQPGLWGASGLWRVWKSKSPHGTVGCFRKPPYGLTATS